MPQFDFSTFPSQIFWLCIIFFAQYLITAKVIVPSFRKIYSDRKSYINSQLQLAQKMVDDAEKLKDNYETKLEQAKAENTAKMNKTLKKLQISADQRINELDNRLAQDLKEYEKKMKKLQISMKGDLDDIVVSSAVTILNKVGNINVNKKTIDKYIN